LSIGRATGGATGLSRQFAKLMNNAGIDPGGKAPPKGGRKVSAKSFHSTRHFDNSQLLNCGLDLPTRMLLSAHESKAVNWKYLHATVDILRQSIEKIPS
jgi:hypothetical protein